MRTDRPRRRAVLNVLRRALSASQRGGDEGMAVVLVLGTAAVLTVLIGGSLVLAEGTQRQARENQDWNAALTAAEAGVEDYLARLNRDPSYWRLGNSAVDYSSGSTGLELPDARPNAFQDWMPVPGTTDRAEFRYDVKLTEFYDGGVITLRSSGRVGDTVRTIETTLGRRGFVDYLYFTDFEVRDPKYYNNTAAEFARCGIHFYDTDAGGTLRRDNTRNNATPPNYDSNGCRVINFSDRDVVNGPLHSNDAIYLCGRPTFNDTATTSYDGARTIVNGTSVRWLENSDGCGEDYPNTVGNTRNLQYAARLEMPPSNVGLRNEVDPGYTGGEPGCLYTGPTEIAFNSNGTMTVTSPWSTPPATQGPQDMWCGVGANLPLPGRGVVYVRSVPTTDDEYTVPLGSATCSANSNAIGYPKRPRSSAVTSDAYACTEGDVFLSGNLDGQLTVGAQNNAYVVDDLIYACARPSGAGPTVAAPPSACDDILGVVANNDIAVLNPVCDSSCNSSGQPSQAGTWYEPTKNVVIEAALLSLLHSFTVENYEEGSLRGDLTVNGAIAQTYRGPVATLGWNGAATGYNKNYRYDPRLKYLSPPHFIDPVQAAYGRKSWTELPAAVYP